MNLDKFREGIIKFYSKDHFSATTGGLTFATPMAAIIEKFSGMSDLVSLKSRVITAGLYYLALGKLIKLRDFSINYFEKKLGKEFSGWERGIHDALMAAGVALTIRTPTYLLSGETDGWKIFWAVLGNTVSSAAFGGAAGYFADLYREILNHEQKPKRIPNFIKNKSYNVKRNFLIGLTAASLTLTGLAYTLIPDREPEQHYEQSTSYIVPKNDEKTIYLEQRMD